MAIATGFSDKPAAITGVPAGFFVILWMTVSPAWSGKLAWLASPFNHSMIIVIATLTVFWAGIVVSALRSRR